MEATGLFSQGHYNDSKNDTQDRIVSDKLMTDSVRHMRYRENSVTNLGILAGNDYISPMSACDNGNNNCSDSNSDSNNSNNNNNNNSDSNRRNSCANIQAPDENDIAKFCTESNFGYSFQTCSISMARFSSWMLKQSCERSLDCVRRISKKLDGFDTGRRFSQPDAGVVDKQRTRLEVLTLRHRRKIGGKQISPLTISSRRDSNSNSNSEVLAGPPYSSLPASPLLWEEGQDQQSILHLSSCHGNQPLAGHKLSSPSPSSSSSPVHPLSPQESQPMNQPPLQHERGFVPPWLAKPTSYIDSVKSQPVINKDIRKSANGLSSASRKPSCASRYLRALHSPTRFLPQQQAIVTTDVEGRLLLFNDIAALCFGIDKIGIGQSILNRLEIRSRRTMTNLLRERKRQLERESNAYQYPVASCRDLMSNQSGRVLMCGVIVPIIKGNGQKSAASLWLKEKWNQDQARFVYLWIFEEICESRLSVTIDSKGMIQDTSLETIQDLYGYERREVIGQSIKKILPSLDIESDYTRDLIYNNPFYASRSKQGRYFPSMVQLQGKELQITSLPTVAGLITVHQNGMVQSMNPVPMKYLFGYKSKDMVESMHIDQLLPQFTMLVFLLQQQQLLRHDRVVTFDECADVLSNATKEENQTTALVATHRDGNQFEVEVQIRLVESEGENLYSVWITHSRVGAATATDTPSQLPVEDLVETAAASPSFPFSSSLCSTTTSPTIIQSADSMTSAESRLMPAEPESSPKSTRTASHEPDSHQLQGAGDDDQNQSNSISQQHQQQQQIKKQEELQPETQPKTISASRIDCFGSIPKERAIFPVMHNQSTGGPSNVVFPELEDYVVVGPLGEGTYGSAKLVHLKSDTSQEFVIKAIVKSRIVIDSWIRDRKYGSIPMEVHILLKLQQHRHVNCPQLATFIEDDDNYYTVTRLHGDGMDLFDYIELNDQMTEVQVRRIFRQVVAAVQHLHHLRIVHRDIKDENILLDDRGIVQLIDFGSAAYYREGRLFDTFSGTLDYCAPEILSGSAYAGPPQDIWSLGILLYTLIYRETPFYSVDDIMERNLQIPYTPYEEKSYGPVNLLHKLLDREVDRRPTVDEVMEDPWLQNEA